MESARLTETQDRLVLERLPFAKTEGLMMKVETLEDTQAYRKRVLIYYTSPTIASYMCTNAVLDKLTLLPIN